MYDLLSAYTIYHADHYEREEDAAEGAGGIDQNVAHLTGASRYEALMELIRSRVKHCSRE